MADVFNLDKQHDDVDSKLIVGFERLSQALRVLLWDKAKQEKLSPIQVQILTYLNYNRSAERRLNKLATRFDLTKSTISDAVKALESKGLVKRTPDSHDARAFYLQLTSKGKKLVQKVEIWSDHIKEVLSELNSQTKEEILLFIMGLIEKLQSAGIINIARMCRTCQFLNVTPNRSEPYYCNFLEKPLRKEGLRIDCPEHQPDLDMI